MPLKVRIFLLFGAAVLLGAMVLAYPGAPRPATGTPAPRTGAKPSQPGEAAEAKGLVAAFPVSFMTRPSGLPALRSTYDLQFARTERMSRADALRALQEGTVDLALATLSDGRVQAYKLHILKDDRRFFTDSYAAPLVRGEALAKSEELTSALASLGGKISNETMRNLVRKAATGNLSAGRVATEFLRSEQLLVPRGGAGPRRAPTRVTVGGKNTLQQQILLEIMGAVLQTARSIDVEKKPNLGGTRECFEALKAGRIDVYAEYTNEALQNILNTRPIPDPKRAFEYLSQRFDRRYDMVWLTPFGFNNKPVLVMSADRAKELEVETISDLAEHRAGRK